MQIKLIMMKYFLEQKNCYETEIKINFYVGHDGHDLGKRKQTRKMWNRIVMVENYQLIELD